MIIKEVEAATGITKQNIRFYEKKGLLCPERNGDNDYRNYTDKDVNNLLLIKMLRKLDMPVEEIKKVLEQELLLPEAIKTHEKKLKEEEGRLKAAITMCGELRKTEEDQIDVVNCLNRMEEIERNGGKFMGILNDYKKIRDAEYKKYFSFMPNNMCLNPEEFKLSLCEYANENNLDLMITKESMYPEFEINGIKYTADRAFSRFGAVIRCRVVDEMDVEAVDVPKERRKKLKLGRNIVGIIIYSLFLVLLSGFSARGFLVLVILSVGLGAAFFVCSHFR